MEAEMLWRKKAACRGVDPALFFPGEKNPGLEAKRVCKTCEVSESCLQYALKNEEDGVWGGKTAKERRSIVRRMRRR